MLFGGLIIKPKPVEIEPVEVIEHDMIFDEIKETIIQGIRNVNYIVWAIVAWFTDVEISNELKSKKEPV